MLLGKRQRPPIKRTTSMTEFTLDLTFTGEIVANCQPSDPSSGNPIRPTRNNRRNSGDFSESTHFLRSCTLCKRRLFPGRDIFMYRGDSAFCSLECRQQQIIQDERKEKCSVASMKEVASSISIISTGSELVSTSAEVVVAMV